MYQIDDKVWAIIHQFDTPKEVKITAIKQSICNVAGNIIHYVVKYKHKEFEINNTEVYPDKETADIFWSILMIQDYEQTLKIPELFATDDYEIANTKAKKLIAQYIETHPDLLLKYL